MKLSMEVQGDLDNLNRFLKGEHNRQIRSVLEQYARAGVAALASSTPSDSGLTAASWGYEVQVGPRSSTITWTNSNVNDGVNVAIILQYGHGTGTGGYVVGRDYINPAIKPIMDDISQKVGEAILR